MAEKIEAMSPALGVLGGFLQSLQAEYKKREAAELAAQKEQAAMYRSIAPAMIRERGEMERFRAGEAGELERFMAGLEQKERAGEDRKSVV